MNPIGTSSPVLNRQKSLSLSKKANKSVNQKHAKQRGGHHLSIGALIWERAQIYAMIFLCTMIGFTLFYLFYFAWPRLIDKPVGSPIFPAHIKLNWAILIAHVVTAIPPLFIGMFAFSKRLRNASLKWHRWMGTAYCVCIWISALLGVLLALANTHGPIAKAGFGFLGLGWFVTTWLAYKTARVKNIVSHRRWMIRSFALTLAVVTIRPMFLIDPLFGFTSENWYLLATWICWVPNLLIAEIYVRTTKPNGKLIAVPR